MDHVDVLEGLEAKDIAGNIFRTMLQGPWVQKEKEALLGVSS